MHTTLQESKQMDKQRKTRLRNRFKWLLKISEDFFIRTLLYFPLMYFYYFNTSGKYLYMFITIFLIWWVIKPLLRLTKIFKRYEY